MSNVPLFRLEPHPKARSQAVASSSVVKGTVVWSTRPIATILLDSEKGRRCDSCLRARANLHRCTACKDYWYCDSNCQAVAWKAHHRRLCKRLLPFVASREYAGLSPPEKLHTLLLAQLLAEHAKPFLSAFLELPTTQRQEDLSNPISTMLRLLPQQNYNHVVPTIKLDDLAIPNSLLTYLSSRFANNNFTIHDTRMIVFAHGVFPSASRSFNHSCVPSAVPLYRHSTESRGIIMDVRLLRDIEPGEEITIPYTDPALPYSTRKLDLELTYGFTCECFLCSQAQSSPMPPSSEPDVALWATEIRKNVLPAILYDIPPPLELKQEFLRTWHPSYLSQVAESFSNASHDGPYELAIRQGATLLAVYNIVYPPNFPMIGLHALELAKTCWNAVVTGHSPPKIQQDIETYLNMAERSFLVALGDDVTETSSEDDPRSEARVLREVLKSSAEVGM